MEKVSVIIPAYNCAKYIAETLKSVRAQKYPYVEIIIVDDGSTDNTAGVLQPFIGINNVKYFRQANKGPSSARNKGIKEATGSIIAFLDADDQWLPDKLQHSIDFMERHNFDWICTSMIKMLPNGQKMLKRIPDDCWVLDKETKEIKQLKNGIFFFSDIPVHAQTIIARRRCFENVGVFDESLIIGEDTDLWFRFEEAGLRGGYLDEPLTIYNYNEKSLTKGKKVDCLEEQAKVARKHALILDLRRPEIRNSYAMFLWQTADVYFGEKQYFKAFKYILLSVNNDLNMLGKIRNKLCRR